MGKAKVALAVVGVGVGGVVLAAGGGYLWAKSAANARLAQTYETHDVEIPVPWPLTDDEIAALTPPDGDPPTEQQLAEIALDRALERGRHLVDSRYACTACHGADFSGGVMVDSPVLFQLFGPNLTLGQGSVTADYTMADWDRAVRHGVLSDRTASAMPSEDFVRVSDQELSDVVVLIRSMPPVDAPSKPMVIGPLGAVLLATGQIPLSAAMLEDHHAAHLAQPPQTEPTAAFGAHLAALCTGCHNRGLSGGPMAGGDPSWPEPANLTPGADGLGGWTFEQFESVMREGVRPDATAVQVPMSDVVPYTANMTDTEMQALWAYLQSLPATATP